MHVFALFQLGGEGEYSDSGTLYNQAKKALPSHFSIPHNIPFPFGSGLSSPTSETCSPPPGTFTAAIPPQTPQLLPSQPGQSTASHNKFNRDDPAASMRCVALDGIPSGCAVRLSRSEKKKGIWEACTLFVYFPPGRPIEFVAPVEFCFVAVMMDGCFELGDERAG